MKMKIALRLRQILNTIVVSESMLDYKLAYDDGSSNGVRIIGEARVDHDNKTIILS